MKMKNFFIATFSFLFFVTGSASAVVKDSDVDGLTDEGEISVYQTDPNKYDTDGDGVDDGKEVVDGTNPLDERSYKLAELQTPDAGIFADTEKFPWYLARISGIVAYIIFSLVVMYGIFVSCAKVFFKWVSPPTALAFHQYLSWLGLSMVFLHAFSFLFEKFLHLSVAEIFIPFVLSRPLTSALGYDLGFSVALGIVALYILTILVITAQFRRKIFSGVWRWLHYLSFVGFLIFTVHGFTAGSDSSEWCARGIYIVSVTGVTLLVFVRVSLGIALMQKRRMER